MTKVYKTIDSLLRNNPNFTISDFLQRKVYDAKKQKLIKFGVTEEVNEAMCEALSEHMSKITDIIGKEDFKRNFMEMNGDYHLLDIFYIKMNEKSEMTISSYHVEQVERYLTKLYIDSI